jgi:hypothetical protein
VIEFQDPERRTTVSEDKERMRMEPDRMAEPDEEKDKDVEGHRMADRMSDQTVAREDDDDVEGHRMADRMADRMSDQTAAREDDDDVEGHQFAPQNTP